MRTTVGLGIQYITWVRVSNSVRDKVEVEFRSRVVFRGWVAFGTQLGVRVRVRVRVRVWVRVRVRVRTSFLSVDPGIELGLTVLVTSRRYRQTNSAQALKETGLGLGLGVS